ncbi:MAG: sugar phosphate nucleotidyltransferase [Candidatus Kerfeldbacteria bacterium]
MIDTIVIAAAGRGVRMKHLSDEQPKHLIHVAGKPFLHFLLKLVDQVGFRHIIVVAGYYADIMKKFLDSEPYDITMVNQSEREPNHYGTAMVVKAVEPELKGRPFVLINGDSLYTPEVLRSIREDDGFSHIVGTYHEDPTHYGVLDMGKDAFLKGIIEKPREPVSNLINLGVYVFQPEVFDVVRNVHESPRGEYEIVDAVNMMAADGKIKVQRMAGEWVDFGKPEDIPEVERFLINNKLV